MPNLRSNPILTAIVTLTLASCGGGGGDTFIPDAIKSISIDKMECPIASDGASIPPGTLSKVKATATLTGIKSTDVVWTWDADGGAVTFGAQSKNDNTSTIDITAPGSPAKYKINVHAQADGKRGDKTCELEVK